MEPELGRIRQHSHPYPQPLYPPLSLSNPYPQPLSHPLPLSNPYPQLHSHHLPFSDARLHPLPFPPPHSHDRHEVIQREMEKQRIREEIIMSEIVRRRALEAEVRMELMLERELTLQRGTNGVPLGSSSVMGFESPTRLPMFGTGGEVRSFEDRIIFSLAEKESLNARLENWNGGFDTSPFQRRSTDLRISEVKAVSEGEKEKLNIVLLNSSKPDEDKSGSKRKAVTPPAGPGSSEPSSDGGIMSKKIKEWSCAVCQVSATSEQTLNQHLNGKKHKSKEASLRAQRAGKNYSIGFYPKKATKSVEGPGSGDSGPSESPIPLLTENPTPCNYKKTHSVKGPVLTENVNPDNTKNQFVVVPEEQKKDDLKKNEYRFWCELCHVGTHRQKIMNIHKRGKKHMRRLEASQRNASKLKETVIRVNGEGGNDVDASLEEAGPEDHEVVPEDHDPLDETNLNV